MPEIMLDIAEVIEHWEEILSRCAAGEVFIIAVDGVPKARLEPFRAKDSGTPGVR